MGVCAHCGRENPEGARFCNACATPLVTGGPAGVRKTVTVLFCDLVGSTSLGDRTDPELLREMMSRYHAELRAILERHGGTVEKFVGDAVMAVFGIPQAHEDDALRAVRASVEMRRAVARLGLEVRIGVNTGEVVAGGGETLVTGDAINVAARLEQAANTGEILLGEGTHSRVDTVVRDEPVEPLVLKGKPKPVPAHRLLELLPEVPAFTSPINAPFVGRAAELETLEGRLHIAIGDRSPQLATIVGPPGIGKSRLARELIQRSEARILIGRCLPYGEGITYWPLSEIVSQVGDVRSALGDDGDSELVVSRTVAAIGATEGAASSEEIAWGFRKLFETIARTKPLIVVVDDIHWAEPTLLDLIEYVATFAQDAPLLLLCMARPDLFEVRPGWAAPRPGSALVTLEPLAEGETETLVEALRDLSADSKARIVEAAEGNPLFVEQMVAMQAEKGEPDLEIPPSIQALLSARIDRLEQGERAVIERASIEGRMFHRGSVRALLSESEQAGVGTHLLTLVRKEFVRPDRSQLPGDDGFRFAHILIRDAAYDAIPKRVRADLHERFATWLETKLDGDAPDEILGYHLEQAYRFLNELGRDDELTRALAFRAGHRLADAGRRAHMRRDAPATCALLKRATDLLARDDPDLPGLLELLGYANFGSGDLRGALEILRRSQSAAAVAGERSVELRARMSELIVLVMTDPKQDMEAVLGEARAAIGEIESLDDPTTLARAWHAVTEITALRSDFALLEEAARRRLEFARRAGMGRDIQWAAYWLTLALANGPVPVEEAIRRAEQALGDLPTDQAFAPHLARLYAYAGRHEQARETTESAKQTILELGQRTEDALGVAALALLTEDLEQVEPELLTAAEQLETSGWQGDLSRVAAVLAEVLYRLGRYEEAEEWTRRSERATLPEQVMGQAQWRSTMAKVLARRGEAEEALRLSAEALDWARRSDGLSLLGDVLMARGEVLHLLGRPGDARPALEEALAVYERKGIVPLIERVQAVLSDSA